VKEAVEFFVEEQQYDDKEQDESYNNEEHFL